MSVEVEVEVEVVECHRVMYKGRGKGRGGDQGLDSGKVRWLDRDHCIRPAVRLRGRRQRRKRRRSCGEKRPIAGSSLRCRTTRLDGGRTIAGSPMDTDTDTDTDTIRDLRTVIKDRVKGRVKGMDQSMDRDRDRDVDRDRDRDRGMDTPHLGRCTSLHPCAPTTLTTPQVDPPLAACRPPAHAS